MTDATWILTHIAREIHGHLARPLTLRPALRGFGPPPPHIVQISTKVEIRDVKTDAEARRRFVRPVAKRLVASMTHIRPRWKECFRFPNDPTMSARVWQHQVWSEELGICVRGLEQIRPKPGTTRRWLRVEVMGG